MLFTCEATQIRVRLSVVFEGHCFRPLRIFACSVWYNLPASIWIPKGFWQKDEKKISDVSGTDYVQICFACCSVIFGGCVLIIDRSFACFPNSLLVYSNRFLIIYGLYTTCSYCFHVCVNFRCELFLTIEVKPRWPFLLRALFLDE